MATLETSLGTINLSDNPLEHYQPQATSSDNILLSSPEEQQLSGLVLCALAGCLLGLIVSPSSMESLIRLSIGLVVS